MLYKEELDYLMNVKKSVKNERDSQERALIDSLIMRNKQEN